MTKNIITIVSVLIVVIIKTLFYYFEVYNSVKGIEGFIAVLVTIEIIVFGATMSFVNTQKHFGFISILLILSSFISGPYYLLSEINRLTKI